MHIHISIIIILISFADLLRNQGRLQQLAVQALYLFNLSCVLFV